MPSRLDKTSEPGDGPDRRRNRGPRDATITRLEQRCTGGPDLVHCSPPVLAITSENGSDTASREAVGNLTLRPRGATIVAVQDQWHSCSVIEHVLTPCKAELSVCEMCSPKLCAPSRVNSRGGPTTRAIEPLDRGINRTRPPHSSLRDPPSPTNHPPVRATMRACRSGSLEPRAGGGRILSRGPSHPPGHRQLTLGRRCS
jgi:hypothetical protein